MAKNPAAPEQPLAKKSTTAAATIAEEKSVDATFLAELSSYKQGPTGLPETLAEATVQTTREPRQAMQMQSP